MDVYLERYLSQLRADKGYPSDGEEPESFLDTYGDFIATVTNVAAGALAAETGLPAGLVASAVKAGVDMASKVLKTGDSPDASATRPRKPQYTPTADEMNAIEVMAQTRAFYHSRCLCSG